MARSIWMLCLLPIGGSLMGQSSTYLQDMQQKWENSCAYTLEIAALMPADAYDYQPTDEQMSFHDQLVHIMKNITWLSGTYLSDKKFEGDLEKEEYSKDEILALLKEVFMYSQGVISELEETALNDKVEFFTEQVRNKGQILELLHDHHTHHRGQIIVYLRLKGKKPPRFRGW